MDRNEAMARACVEIDKCFNKAERDAVFGRLYDAGFAAAQEWTPASTPPKKLGVYPVLVDELEGGKPTRWLGEFWPDRNEWIDPFCDAFCDGLTLRVISWMDWPPFEPEIVEIPEIILVPMEEERDGH